MGWVRRKNLAHNVMAEKITKILDGEARIREEANKAFSLAIIVEGLKPVPESEEALDRATSVESVAARVWLAAAQGDMKAILLIRDTLDGLPVQEVKGTGNVTNIIAGFSTEQILRGIADLTRSAEQSAGFIEGRAIEKKA